MKKIDIFIVCTGMLGLIFFIGVGLSVYSVRMENDKLKQQLVEFRTNIQNQKLDIEALKHDGNIYSIKIDVIEESLDPENTRWAKVKKVRDAIKTVIKDKGYRGTPNVKDLTSISAAVVDYSEQYDVPISLILGVMTQESAFRIVVKSNKKARGLMQIISPTAKEISRDVGRPHYNLYNIRHNIQFGTWYIWKMMDRFNGDIELAIRAYNCGPTCVDRVQAGRWLEYPDETVNYHEAVLMWKTEYERMGL